MVERGGVRRLGITRRAWFWPGLLLTLGLFARLTWLIITAPHKYAGGEIANVAIAFSRTGMLTDAFRSGQGPTAHVLPLPPVFAGLVYRLLGVRSDAAEAVLALTSIAIVLVGYALLYRIFGLLGTPRLARLGALAVAMLLPLNFALESIEFRIWEGAFAVMLAMGFLYALQTLDADPREPGTGRVAAMALAAACVAFVSPPLGLAAYAGALLFIVNRQPWQRWPQTVLIAVAALALVVAPWALRNHAIMGEAIPLRSNAGLELGIGNHAAAAAATPDQERAVFRARLEEIHPFESDAAYAAMVSAGGEAPYARLRGAEARAWIVANPGDFARLSLRHVVQFLFPPAWLWSVYSDAERGVTVKQALHWSIAGLGFAGMIVAMWLAARRYRYAALMLVLPVLPYAILQPVLRYRYLIFALSLFFAADLIARLWGRLRPVLGAAGRSAA